jgi:hypothetical protein
LGVESPSKPKRFLIQPKKPVLAAAGALAGARATGAALAAGLGVATGAGASGNTPLMTGVCLLVGSCERRVTVVGSSISSASL